MKTSAAEFAIANFLRPHESNLTYPAQPIREDMLAALFPALEAASSDAEVHHVLEDWWTPRATHLLKSVIPIPREIASAAFGGKPSLKAQGEGVKRYGEKPMRQEAARWNSALGSLTPGVDPDRDTEQPRSKSQKMPSDHSNNPWAKPSRFKSEEAQRAAQASFIKVAGTRAAVAMAKAAGVTLSGKPLRQ